MTLQERERSFESPKDGTCKHGNPRESCPVCQELKYENIAEARSIFLDEIPHLIRSSMENRPLKDIFQAYLQILNLEPNFEKFLNSFLLKILPPEKRRSLPSSIEKLKQNPEIQEAYKEFLFAKLPKAILERKREIKKLDDIALLPLEEIEELIQKREGDGYKKILGLHFTNTKVENQPLLGGSKETYLDKEGNVKDYTGVMYSTDPNQVWAKRGRYLYFLEGSTTDTLVDPERGWRLRSAPTFSAVKGELSRKGFSPEEWLGVIEADDRLIEALGIKTISDLS